MKPAVFLDSGIFIAFMNQRDRWHGQATALFGGLRPRWCTSVLVLSESYSWLLHRMGEEAARNFGLLISNLTDLTLLEATRRHHAEVMRVLDRFHGSKLSYVDASSLAFMQALRIKRVWSTDHHLAIAGAEVLPRS